MMKKSIYILSVVGTLVLALGVVSCSKQGAADELGYRNGVCPLSFIATTDGTTDSRSIVTTDATTDATTIATNNATADANATANATADATANATANANADATTETTTSGQTRATQQTYTTDATLPAAFTIHSTAWFKPNDGSKESTYFFDAPFTKQDGSWQNDTYRYWPVGGLLEFLCIAVDDSIMPLSDFDAFKWNDNKSTSSVTIDIPNMQKMQSEVLFAAKKPTDRDAAVSLEFKHSQALLEFKFDTGEAKEDHLVRLDSLTIDNIYMIGKLKVNNTGTNPTATWNFNYSYPVTAYVPDVKGSEPVNATDLFKHLIVPAQPVGEMTLHYTKRDSLSHAWSKGSEYTAKLRPKDSRWEMGKKYTYAVTFNHSDNTITIPGDPSDNPYVTVTEYSGSWSMDLTFEN